MRASNLFLLIVFTVFDVLLFWTGVPEFCAFGFFLALFCIMGWAEFILKVSKW